MFAVLALMAAAPGPVVAVFDIDAADARLKKKSVEQLGDYMRTVLASGGAYRVVPRSEIRARLSEQKKESYKACYDEACQIEVGKELAAEKSLHTKIARFGNTCVVTSTLYDLARAASETAAHAKGPCGDGDLLKTLEDVAGQLSGAPAKTAVGGASSTAIIATEDAPPPAPKGRLKAGSPQVLGSLSKKAIKRVIRRHAAAIRNCYERELRIQPKLAGKVTVRFTIGADGRVISAMAAKSTLGNKNVENCIVARVKRWKFPKPKGGGIVNINYPFVLRPS